MAKLTAKKRNALPDSAFAGPGRSFPVQDASHARNALARASQFHPELKSRPFDPHPLFCSFVKAAIDYQKKV